MRALILLALAAALLGGCASQPTTPRDRADSAAVMGMMLMAGAAAEPGSAASVLWQVRIPPPAFEVLSRIQAHRRTAGGWPRSEEIALPEGVTEIVLQGADEDLAVTIKREEADVLRCKILKDGTVVATPMVDEFMTALRAQRAGNSSSMPVFLPPKK